MKKLKSALLIVLALCMVFGVLAGCSKKESEVAAIKKNGKLVILTNAEFAPYEYLGDDNKIVGVDIEIAQYIADELGVELQVENMDFEGIVAALAAGKGNLGVAGLSIDPDRLKSVDFSIEYATSSQYVIVAADNEEIKTEADLKGKIIGAQNGTTGDFYASDDIEDAQVMRYGSAMEAATALMSGKLDAVIIDELTAKSIVGNNSSKLKMLDQKLTEESYAIAVNKKSDLLPVVNKVLQKLVDDGTIDELTTKHTGANS